MVPARMKRLAALLVILSASVAMLLIQRKHKAFQSNQAAGPAALINPEVFHQFNAIEAREQQVDESTWASERRAEEYGEVLDALWDQLNRTSNRFDVLASFPVGELVV